MEALAEEAAVVEALAEDAAVVEALAVGTAEVILVVSVRFCSAPDALLDVIAVDPPIVAVATGVVLGRGVAVPEGRLAC